jgi:hypothetical protein
MSLTTQLNLVSLADHYFSTPGPRRDALLEATGRELQKFGLYLTDDGEGALLPRRGNELGPT